MPEPVARRRRPLRICMITTFYPPYNFGGDGVFVRRLAHELADRGHGVEVIHCLDSYKSVGPQPALQVAEHPNVTVHRLQSGYGLLAPLAAHQTGRPLLQASRIRSILAKGFDVIHYHNVSLVGGPGLLELGDAVKLYTLHDYWLVCPTHALFRFNRSPCVQPKYCALCTLSYKRPVQWWRYTGAMDRAVEHIDAFIAPSLTSQRKHEELGLRGRIEHLPNFVTFDAPMQAAPAAVAAQPYFLFVGRLEKLKGLHTLISLFQQRSDVQLWIAGTGSEAEALRTMAAGSTNIRFLGHQSGERLRLLYANATAVLYPSVNFQTGRAQLKTEGGRGAPLVIMEALSQSTPVIASNLGQIPTILEQTGGGLVYSSEEELVGAIDLLLNNPEKRRAIGERGFQAYRENWTADVYLDGYLALVDELSAARRTRLEPEKVRVVEMTAGHLDGAARLHRRVLPDSRTAGMGFAYVRRYLGWFLRGEHGAVALAAVDKRGDVVGYLVGAQLGYARSLSRYLAWASAAAVLRRPGLFLRERFRHGLGARAGLLLGAPAQSLGEPEAAGPTLSLVAMGVAPAFRHSGVGAGLVDAFEDRARRAAIADARLSTQAENLPARTFYESRGWKVASEAGGLVYYVRRLI